MFPGLGVSYVVGLEGGDVLRFFLSFLASEAEAAGPLWAAMRAALVVLEEGSLVAALVLSEDIVMR